MLINAGQQLTRRGAAPLLAENGGSEGRTDLDDRNGQLGDVVVRADYLPDTVPDDKIQLAPLDAPTVVDGKVVHDTDAEEIRLLEIRANSDTCWQRAWRRLRLSCSAELPQERVLTRQAVRHGAARLVLI
jgi:hypothetical protein